MIDTRPYRLAAEFERAPELLAAVLADRTHAILPAKQLAEFNDGGS